MNQERTAIAHSTAAASRIISHVVAVKVVAIVAEISGWTIVIATKETSASVVAVITAEAISASETSAAANAVITQPTKVASQRWRTVNIAIVEAISASSRSVIAVVIPFALKI